MLFFTCYSSSVITSDHPECYVQQVRDDIYPIISSKLASSQPPIPYSGLTPLAKLQMVDPEQNRAHIGTVAAEGRQFSMKFETRDRVYGTRKFVIGKRILVESTV